MGLDDLFNTKRSLVRSRARQIRIGDLLFGVAMTALGLSALTAGDLAGRERLLLGLFALSFFALVGAQWALAGMRCNRARPVIDAAVGVLSALMALSMFTCLVFVGIFFPHVAALLSVMLLLQVVYLITWE
jgi:hypothetical protein